MRRRHLLNDCAAREYTAVAAPELGVVRELARCQRPILECSLLKQRRRLETRLAKLPKLYSWGDLTDEAYRREMAETRKMLAKPPDPNKLLAFDRNRHVMVTMAENVEKATRPQLAELVQLHVERVKAEGRTVDPKSIEWTPPARPLFGEAAWV